MGYFRLWSLGHCRQLPQGNDEGQDRIELTREFCSLRHFFSQEGPHV